MMIQELGTLLLPLWWGGGAVKPLSSQCVGLKAELPPA